MCRMRLCGEGDCRIIAVRGGDVTPPCPKISASAMDVATVGGITLGIGLMIGLVSDSAFCDSGF